MPRDTTKDAWGHAQDVYDEAIRGVSATALQELDVMLLQAVPSSVFRLGHPKDLTEFYIHASMLARTIVCWLLAEGYLTLTESGTRVAENEPTEDQLRQLLAEAADPPVMAPGGYL